MAAERVERSAPMTGVICVLLLGALVVLGGYSPSLGSAIVAAYALVFFLWFAACTRELLAAAQGGASRLANPLYVAAVVIALGLVGTAVVEYGLASGELGAQAERWMSDLRGTLLLITSSGAALVLLAAGLVVMRADEVAARS